MFNSAGSGGLQAANNCLEILLEHCDLESPTLAKATRIPTAYDSFGDPAIQAMTIDSFALESGVMLDSASLGFTVYGHTPGIEKPLIIWYPALSGTSRAGKCQEQGNQSQGDGWGANWIGHGVNPKTNSEYLLNLDTVTVICLEHFAGRDVPNAGTSAENLNVERGTVSLRDGINLAIRVLKELMNIHSVHAVIGGSMGGGQALQWLFQNVIHVDNIVDISGSGVLTPLSRSFFDLQERFLNGEKNLVNAFRSCITELQDSLIPQRKTSGLKTACDHVLSLVESSDVCADPNARLSAMRQFGFLFFVSPEYLELKAQEGCCVQWLQKHGERFLDRFDSAGLASLCGMVADAPTYSPEDVASQLAAKNCTRLIRTANFGDTLFCAEDQVDYNIRIANALQNADLFNPFYTNDKLTGHDHFLSEAFLEEDVPFLRRMLSTDNSA